mmetsp:Transcript_3741/g.13845  ORF Transcript_3741/g.13845 Transcript_3741/m.13845 type:complete len:221 (-) Transcript_3741:1550-2212(-)
MICSSRSLRRCVSMIMMSRCFSSSCLYRSTCAFSSSMLSRSRSSRCMRSSYSLRSASWCSRSAARKAGVSFMFLGVPPMSTCPCSIEMRCSSLRFSAFSRMKARERASSSRMAAILSSSARRFCSSSSSTLRLSTTLRERSSSSARSRFSSRSYRRSSDFWSTSSLMRASFLMLLARLANLSVDSDSAKASSAGEIIAIIVDLQLPPSESSRMRVSFESR